MLVVMKPGIDEEHVEAINDKLQDAKLTFHRIQSYARAIFDVAGEDVDLKIDELNIKHMTGVEKYVNYGGIILCLV
ncbi:MAG: hypothetical protein AB1420_00495 [Bacillota bacterium]